MSAGKPDKEAARRRKAKQALSDANKKAWAQRQAFSVPMDREGQLREAERLQERERNKGKPAAAPVTDPGAVKRAEAKQARSEANKQAWENLRRAVTPMKRKAWLKEVERLLQEWKGKPPVKKKPTKPEGTPKSPPKPKPMTADEKMANWERMSKLWQATITQWSHQQPRNGEDRKTAEKRWLGYFIKTLSEEEADYIRCLADRREAQEKLQAAQEAQRERAAKELAEEQARKEFEIIKDRRLRELEEKKIAKRRHAADRKRERERERARAAEIPLEKKAAYVWLVNQPHRQTQRILEHYGGCRAPVQTLIAQRQHLQHLQTAYKDGTGGNLVADQARTVGLGIRQLRREHRRAFGIELERGGLPLDQWNEKILNHYKQATDWAFSVTTSAEAGLDSAGLREFVIAKIKEDHLACLGVPLAWEPTDDCVQDSVELLSDLFVFETRTP